MRVEAEAFEMGARWALKTLTKALVQAEARTLGSAHTNAIHLSDCMAPPMILIAQAIRAEAEALFPDYQPTEADIRRGKFVPVSQMKDFD
jgi:hypothetical protein